MLALIYLAVATLLGDRICGRFWQASSVLHRWTAAFLVGVLISTWITYLLAAAFAFTAHPLLWANLIHFLAAISFIFFFPARKLTGAEAASLKDLNWRDAVFLAAFILVACWFMFGTLSMRQGDVRVSSVAWNDFGPNLALMQSFALGHNFPAQYPYFIGEPIRYHFLFWFQAGNLEFLGLSLSCALNLLSALSMTALLVAIMTLGEALFGSRSIGGIAALLLFFHGSLSWVPFLASQHSIAGAFKSIWHLDHWLKSGFPYKGEDWGIWSPSILYVQRHLLGAVGVVCLVLIFLVDFYKRTIVSRDPVNADGSVDSKPADAPAPSENFPTVWSFIFSGALVGMLVFWNSAIFISALAVVGALFLLFPGRKRLAILLATALLIGVPQVLALGVTHSTHKLSIFHWGYTIEHATIAQVVTYFLFTFGPKLAVAIVAIVLLGKLPRLFFLAMISLVVLAFGTQLNVDIMNNQKFLYFWLILLNLFVAYGLARIFQFHVGGKIAAVLLSAIVIAAGAVDLFRVHNDNWIDIPFRNNALSNWLLQNTQPSDVFLTEKFVHHPILMNGRRIYYGWSYFPWSMGYRTGERDETYKQMLTEQNPDKLIELLKQNGIDYVAIDDGLRNGYLHVGPRESPFAAHLPKVFQDTEKRFGNLNIYKVPR
jgi:hypothetical protein